MLPLNEIIEGDACEVMKQFPDASIPFTLTSPPYGTLRSYDCRRSTEFEARPVASELFRVTQDGGVVVWVVNDMLVNGSETGTSFRHALQFIGAGFSLYDTMIYKKQNPIPRKQQKRYTQQFEYMFVFVKGKLKTFHPLQEKCNYAGVKSTGTYYEQPDTKVPFRSSKKSKPIADVKTKGNVWEYWVGNNKKQNKTCPHTFASGPEYQHSAKMPLSLAVDHVLSWTDAEDVVLDPMCGSGTTLVAAVYLKRRYIGIDISAEYVKMSRHRIKESKKEIERSDCLLASHLLGVEHAC